MAKVTGPFMSIAASGTLAKTLTASIWKGRPYMRLRVIPQNPNSVGQQAVRSIIGTLAKACRAVLTAFTDTVNFVGSAFFQDAVLAAPAGQSWISYLQKVMNGNFAGFVTSYAALDSTHKGYWVAAATGIGMADYTDRSSVLHTSGEQLYQLGNYAFSYLDYTGFASGVDAANGTETSDFADYVSVTNP